MIHNSSSDPVLIKKISLKIWSLRDEIEARIQEKIGTGATLDENEIMQIRSQYTTKTGQLSDKNVLPLKSSSELGSTLDTGEDDMARAMADAMEESEAQSTEDQNENESPENGGETSENQGDAENNIISLNSQNQTTDNNIITISLDAPNIPEEKIAKGKTVLAEISMDRMFFFSNKAFTEGQSIVIQFCIPKSFIVNADILYCRPFNLKSRIISQNNYTHRVLIRFQFLKEGERALLRQFLQSIEPDLTNVVRKAPAKTEEETGSDFGELDDLGL